MKKILVEASGSLVCGWLIKAIKESNNIAVSSDVNEDCVGRYLSDQHIVFPKSNDQNLWEAIEENLIRHKVNIVIPSFDETLLGWTERKEYFKTKYNIDVVISNREVIEICIDKYKTYEFFLKNNIPTPQTSIENKYELIKPRIGRGAKGIFINEDKKHVNMNGLISQEIVYGKEYTIDCLIDFDGEPIYIVPRQRHNVKDGKSINGVVEKNTRIINYVEEICKSAKFFGPINIQCFDDGKNIYFIEINPRIAGGMALGVAATENWINLITNYILKNIKTTNKKEIKYGLRMYRYYEEVFI